MKDQDGAFYETGKSGAHKKNKERKKSGTHEKCGLGKLKGAEIRFKAEISQACLKRSLFNGESSVFSAGRSSTRAMSLMDKAQFSLGN